MMAGKEGKSGSPSLGNKQNDHTPSPQATPTPSKTSPPPVTYTPSTNTDSHSTTNSNTNAITSSASASNGETSMETITSPIPGPSRSDSVSSDSGVVYFDPSIPGEARVPPTGDTVRDRCRELLAKAMLKGFENGEH